MKILFLIRSLGAGGAERQLVALANGLRERGHDVTIVVFYGGGILEGDLDNIRLFNLEKAGRWDIISFFYRLWSLLRRERPEVLHSYLGTSNILGALAKILGLAPSLVWGIRASNMKLSNYSWLSRLDGWLEARLSGLADTIIANSHAGKAFAKSRGIEVENMLVVPNGIDVHRFHPDAKAGRAVRNKWGVKETELLVGLVGRLDPMKGHSIFLEACVPLVNKFENVRFVCVGGGPAEVLQSLRQKAQGLGLGDRVVWAGAETEMTSVYNALDVLCSSSVYGEGFSNAIGEAMACGTACVVTDVGDSAIVVGDTGIVVPPNSSLALAEGLSTLLSDSSVRVQLGQMASDRIVDAFSLSQMVERSHRILSVC